MLSKKFRKTFKNSAELCHAWAYARHDAGLAERVRFSGSDIGEEGRAGNVSFGPLCDGLIPTAIREWMDGTVGKCRMGFMSPVLYSYDWYAVGWKFTQRTSALPNDGYAREVALFNCDTYSTSTSRHTNLGWRSVSCPTFSVPFPVFPAFMSWRNLDYTCNAHHSLLCDVFPSDEEFAKRSATVPRALSLTHNRTGLSMDAMVSDWHAVNAAYLFNQVLELVKKSNKSRLHSFRGRIVRSLQTWSQYVQMFGAWPKSGSATAENTRANILGGDSILSSAVQRNLWRDMCQGDWTLRVGAAVFPDYVVSAIGLDLEHLNRVEEREYQATSNRPTTSDGRKCISTDPAALAERDQELTQWRECSLGVVNPYWPSLLNLHLVRLNRKLIQTTGSVNMPRDLITESLWNGLVKLTEGINAPHTQYHNSGMIIGGFTVNGMWRSAADYVASKVGLPAVSNLPTDLGTLLEAQPLIQIGCHAIPFGELEDIAVRLGIVTEQNRRWSPIHLHSVAE